jgi:hypothetical protein
MLPSSPPKPLSRAQEINSRRSSRIANMEHKKKKTSTFVSSAQSRKTNQISLKEASVQVQPHSDVDINVVHNANINIESKVEEGKPLDSNDYNASPPKQHPNRNSNIPQTAERNKKEKLQLPKSYDPIWKELDKDLSIALPMIFKKSLFRKLTSDELIRKFDDWIYKFFLDRCGVMPIPEQKAPFVKKPHKALERVREDKKRIRRLLRDLARAGWRDTPEWNKYKSEWLFLIRKHNRLRNAHNYAKKKQAAAKAEKAFRADPYKYTKQLFNPSVVAGDPAFTKEVAENYFPPLYRDTERDYKYVPLDGLKRPDIPQHLFDIEPPTLKEMHRIARKKKNNAAAGINGLMYIIYKRCPSILFYLHKICMVIWKSKDIPAEWAITYIALLAKTFNFELPEEFRPIAVGNTDGKIFFSVIATRLQTFMTSNNYIKIKKQKGFLEGMAGCIEHSFALYEAFRNATRAQRSIVSTWIDLANAYGSVKHNLIQFALDWYHVPKCIQEMIFDYYEKLCAMIVTKKWSTGCFLFDIGCFQGCVLSAILFDCVFNLLLDFLEPHLKLGYIHKVKDVDLITMDKAYADDLNLTTIDSASNQIVLNTTDTWLNWTRTMKAKPKKCVSFAQRKFTPGSSRGGFVAIKDTIYSPYDPKLTIAGQPIQFILDPSNKDPFKSRHFKFLGRWISVDVNETQIQTFVKDEFLRVMNLIECDVVNGLMKAWMYQFGVLTRLTWPCLVHDLPLSFGKDLDRITTRHLKKWIGVHRSADVGILYRSKERFGLNLTPTSTHLQKTGVVKCLLLQSSKDPDIQLLYKVHEERKANETGRVWSSTRSASEAKEIVQHNIRFAGQTNKQGLGSGLYDHDTSDAAIRKLCTNAITDVKAEELWSHSHGLSMQGLWAAWAEHTLPLDFSWNNLIFGPGKRIISFLLNATINTLSSPYFLNIMGFQDTDLCALCKRTGYVSHILSGCPVALYTGRYNWRHDSILFTMIPELEKHIVTQNASKVITHAIPPLASSFISAKPLPEIVPKARPRQTHLLSLANDWKLLVDLHTLPITFPPEICVSIQRPDIIIWSSDTKSVLLIELTSPSEEGLVAANIRKSARYLSLSDRVESKQGWKCTIFPFEVGARGFVARSMNTMLRKIGFTPHAASKLCKTVSLTAAYCSYSIWNNRTKKEWPKRLLFRPGEPDPPSEVT